MRARRHRPVRHLLLPSSRKKLGSIREMPYQQMGICGIELTAAEVTALATFSFAIASEAIGRSKLKDNSVIDVVLRLAKFRALSSLTGAHTPKRTTPAPPRADSPAPKKRGRPAKRAPSSKT